MIEAFFNGGFATYLTAFTLGSSRLMMFAVVAPFMGNAALNMTVRSALVLALYLVIHPAVYDAVLEMGPLDTAHWIHLIALIFKEIFIGFVLGWMAGMVFWAVEGAGFFIDNQRGAGQAAETDPLTGDQSSPTGSFLFQSTTYAFFASGCFATFLGLVYSTYLIWPVDAYLPAAIFETQGAALFFGKSLAALALNIVLISAPVVLACLFTDISLGLINRFAPQLNVYILAMPIKSGLASFLLIFYFALLMTDAADRFSVFGVDLKALEVLLRLAQ